mgnify:CR=1 FL=1
MLSALLSESLDWLFLFGLYRHTMRGQSWAIAGLKTQPLRGGAAGKEKIVAPNGRALQSFQCRRKLQPKSEIGLDQFHFPDDKFS